MKLRSLTTSRILHLARDAADLTDLIAASLRGRRWHLPGDRPDEAGEFTGDGGGDLRFRLAACHQFPEAGRQTELRLPRDVADRLRQRFLPIQHLSADPRDTLVRPRRLGEQPARMRIARLRNAATADTGSARVLRRHEAEKRHELPRMIEAADVADFGDEANRSHKRDPTQRLHRVHDRCPTRRRRVLPQLVGQALDPPLGLVDRVAILLQRDVLRRQRKAEIRQPPAIRLRPAGAPRIAASLAQQERLQPMLRLSLL